MRAEDTGGRHADLSCNAVAVERLRALRSAGPPLVWTGRGASFAFAQGFAAVCRRLGIPSFAVPASDISDVAGLRVVVVSRSASPTAFEPSLVIAEEGSSLGWTDAPCLAVPERDKGARPWLPLAFGSALARCFAEALEVELAPIAPPPTRSDDKISVLVAESNTSPSAALIATSETKIGPVPFLAVDLDEVGHGLHAQLWRDPAGFAVHLIGLGGSPYGSKLQRWCDGCGVEVVEIPAPAATSPAVPLDLLLLTSGLLGTWCRRTGRSPDERPLPEALDTLRQGNNKR